MHKAVFISVSALLGLHSAPLVAAPQVLGGAAISIDASSEIASALYAASATQEAFARSADARIQQLRSEVETLKVDVAAGKAAAETLAAREQTFVHELAERDRAYAREIAVFRDAVEDIAATTEGLNALAMFNEGNELGAIAILDDLRAARDAARQERVNIESAAEARRIATLALEARNLGKLTTQNAIDRYLEITKLDPDAHWDWVQLGRLYNSIGSLPDARTAAEKAKETAMDDRDLSVALNALGEVQRAQGDLAEAYLSHDESLSISERLAASDVSNKLWQTDLAISYNRVGDILREQGDSLNALDRCCQSNANQSPASKGVRALIQPEAGAILRGRRFSSI